MTTNVMLKCQHCNDIIHARIGFSNQDNQILRFVCCKCTSPITIQLDVDFNNTTWKVSVAGGEEISISSAQDFGKSNQFVDLHLDFPTYYGKYEMGITPFIRASGKLGNNLIPYQHILSLLQSTVADKDKVNAIIRFYLSGDIQLFKKTIYEYLDEKNFPCEKPVDINRALYQILELSFMSLINPPENTYFVETAHEKLTGLYDDHKESFGSFLRHIMNTDFLQELQKDCLTIYERILESNEIFRPALYYEFVKDENKETSLRIANSDFAIHKGLFQDISEIISRQLILIAGINNIDKRGNYNSFSSTVKKHPKNLDEFANRSFGSKPDYIDDTFWKKIVLDVTNNRLRNAIAHHKVEYDEISQKIKYYYKLEGLRQQKHKEISFMGFTITLLESFRWLHRFNHIIKMLYVFWYLKYEKECK